ncbi:rab effector MyRIP [Antennarius striatus]|uniref:rab effector MyRIP n=1 Tax=Antennarius striatus TaxID=241820 RepID=UPI0035B243E4
MEDVPYLEILCVSDSTSNTFQNQEAAQVEESSAIKSNHDYEKQGSLIALAWSRPPEDDADYEAQPAGQSKDAESSLEMQITNYVTSGVGEHTERDETSTDQKPTGDPEAYMEEKQCSTITEEDRSPAERESTLREREQAGEAVSVLERERTMRNLVDMQRKVEQRQQRDRERQLLRVQERLSIIQSRKAEEDLLGLKNTDRLRHLTEDLPQEDKDQQKTLVKERLEQLRRERSYVMQSKRDRNTAGFNELLGPVALQSRETEDGAD